MSVKKTTFLTAAAFAFCLCGIFNVTYAQAQPTLLKRTVQVNPKRFLRYWKNPAAAEPVYNTYSWVPQIGFELLGPIEAGSKLYVEFDMPDGKPWTKYDMRTPQLAPDEWESIKTDSIDESVLEKKAILNEGIFPFRIKLKNALSGTDKVLFSGKFRVGTYLLDQSIPDYKGKKDFFVDYDWHVPLAYLWLNPQSDENAPQLATQVCLRGAVESSKLEGYLFYNGKQIAKKSAMSSAMSTRYTSAADEPSHRWGVWDFTFDQVRGFNKNDNPGTYAGHFILDKNPGDYEIKVMRDNQLSRVVKFTVGKDGKIVDNGVAKQAAMGGVRMIVPAQVIGTADTGYRPTAWQTEALFYNPLAGFSAQ